MKPRTIVIFGVLFIVCVLLFAIVWHWQMAGKYFVCTHSGLLLDFLPPFVHSGGGDFFIKPARVVYVMWAVYVGLAVAIPAACAWLCGRLYERDLKRSWS